MAKPLFLVKMKGLIELYERKPATSLDFLTIQMYQDEILRYYNAWMLTYKEKKLLIELADMIRNDMRQELQNQGVLHMERSDLVKNTWP